MNSDVQPGNRNCPACGAANELDSLSKREYRCLQCNLELAHLDVAANGVIRGIFGWLRDAGSTIEDRYRVLSVLGKGGFGATYLVEDLRLSGKRRAIKEVPELLFDEYETSLLSRLNHPSIPDIIDRNTAEGMVYLVLEFGGSKTLGSERKQYQGRIPLSRLMPWMRQLCEVLIYLHEQNPPIIHRDLKPDNILLDENGRIMLIDFGIAKESTPATMTRTIGRAATHGFSPPEQAMGTGTDERSDIYALAATFYALLTGENPPAAHERVAGKDLAPPSQLVPGLSPSLESALLRALNLNVNLRQQTMKELNLAFEAIDNELSGLATHPAQYTERTVMISNKTGATGLHPPSLKLPSEPLSAQIPIELTQDVPANQAGSKKKALFLVLGLVTFLATAITGGYFFWPASKTENVETVSAQPDTEAASMTASPSLDIPDAVNPLAPGSEAAPATTAMAPPVANTSGATTTPNLPATPAATNQPRQNKSTGSAALAFDKKFQEKLESGELKTVQEKPSPPEKVTPKPRLVTAQKRRDDPPPKRRIIQSRRETARPPQNTGSKPAGQDSGNWLDDFSNSGNRVR